MSKIKIWLFTIFTIANIALIATATVFWIPALYPDNEWIDLLLKALLCFDLTGNYAFVQLMLVAQIEWFQCD